MENKIPEGNYIGYLWYSNEDEPKKYIGNGQDIDLEAFPFIAEGMIWDEKRKTSVMINYTHKMNVAVYENIDINAVEIKTYKGHKIGKNGIKFFTIWEAENDPLCENMAVLEPKANVFIGFKN